MTILEVRNLSASYDKRDVIHDVSFSVRKGEFVSFLGRNGSGKSTLIKALQKLLRRFSGDVVVEGQNLYSLDRRQIARKIAYVPQIFQAAFDFSVEEIVQMGRYVHQSKLSSLSSEDTKVLSDVMALTEITAFKDKKLAHLSGGEQQRVFIARALAQDSPIIFLDEPSTHLDISYQVEVYKILKRLQEEKQKTILLAEHNINLSIPYSDRLFLLKNGSIFAQGPPRKMITKSHIKEVFHAEVDIQKNPQTHLPEISLIPWEEKES